MKNFTQRERATIERALTLIAEKAPDYGDAMTAPNLTKDYLKLFFATRMDREHFVAMFLNAQHHVITTEVLFSGTIDGAAVYPREVVKAALKHNAAAMVLAHNHPSGLAEPSQADRRITDRLRDSLMLIDVRILDHIIVANGGSTYSFAECGLI